MANPFYARYIPPKLNVGIAESNTNLDQSQSLKRRKTSLGFQPIAVSVEDLPEILAGAGNPKQEANLGPVPKAETPKKNNEHAVSEVESSKTRKVEGNVEYCGTGSKKEKRRKPKENIKPAFTPENGARHGNHLSRASTAPDEDSKHKKILTRYENSAKASAPTLNKEDLSNDQDLNEKEPDRIEIHGLVPLPQPPQVLDFVTRPTFSALPDWIAQPTVVSASNTISFDSLHLDTGILASLNKKGYRDAFAIQAAILPLLLPGSRQHPGDICISAVTGSGKTLAYALPIVENLRDKPMTRLRGLIVVPTRELVVQVRECLELCSAGSRLKIGTAIGSKSFKEEQQLLIGRGQRFDPCVHRAETERSIDENEQLLDWDFDDLVDKAGGHDSLTNYVLDYFSKVDILICTPGRLVDHIQFTKGFTLDHVQWLVIDEADRLLDESFQQWVEIVIPALENQGQLDLIDEQLFKTFHYLRERKVRKILLSATMTRDISKLAALKLRRAKMLVLENKSHNADHSPAVENDARRDIQNCFELPPNLKEIAIPVESPEDKPLHLIELIQERITRRNVLGPLLEPGVKVQTTDESVDEPSSDSDDGSKASSLTCSSGSSDQSKFSLSKCQGLNPQLASRSRGTLIFTNNNENALRLARLLILLRPSWRPQISTLTKSTATTSGRKTLNSFRSGKSSILIASDRASRGLDIPELADVINYDMPTSETSYVHRVGRTARAGREGCAATLVVRHEARWFWNVIARGKGIVRGDHRKVRRSESKLKGWGDMERREYEVSLRTLGEEARGERK